MTNASLIAGVGAQAYQRDADDMTSDHECCRHVRTFTSTGVIRTLIDEKVSQEPPACGHQRVCDTVALELKCMHCVGIGCRSIHPSGHLIQVICTAW